MQFKGQCGPDFSYWTLKTVSTVLQVTSSQWRHHSDHFCKDTSLCPYVCVRIREVQLYDKYGSKVAKTIIKEDDYERDDHFRAHLIWPSAITFEQNVKNTVISFIILKPL